MTETMSGNQELFEFFKSKGHNSAVNYSTQTKSKLNLHILKKHPYSEFQLKFVHV